MSDQHPAGSGSPPVPAPTSVPGGGPNQGGTSRPSSPGDGLLEALARLFQSIDNLDGTISRGTASVPALPPRGPSVLASLGSLLGSSWSRVNPGSPTGPEVRPAPSGGGVLNAIGPFAWRNRPDSSDASGTAPEPKGEPFLSAMSRMVDDLGRMLGSRSAAHPTTTVGSSPPANGAEWISDRVAKPTPPERPAPPPHPAAVLPAIRPTGPGLPALIPRPLLG